VSFVAAGVCTVPLELIIEPTAQRLPPRDVSSPRAGFAWLWGCRTSAAEASPRTVITFNLRAANDRAIRAAGTDRPVGGPRR
jgi:hypothetical protein